MMNKTILRLAIVIVFLITLPCPTLADKEFDDMYKEYVNHYNLADGRDDEFYELSNKLKKHYLNRDDLASYYKIEMNEAIYESIHNRQDVAIRKSVEILNTMQEKGYNGKNLVYLALGSIFESSGNQSIAKHYFKEAIDNTNDHDDRLAMDAFSRMASMLKLTNPQEAQQWNDKYAFVSEKYPPYRQVYLFVNAVIAFAQNNKEEFWKRRDSYYAYRKEKAKELDNHGVHIMKVMEEAFNEQYDKALQLLKKNSGDLDDIAVHDMRIHIYQMQQLPEMALQASLDRAYFVDSLSSGMQLHNIRELRAEVALAKARNDAASQYKRMLTIVILLSFLIILLLGINNYIRQKSRQRMAERNEQLKTALSMAEESDKMKTEFVRSVSHEIRTPLNAINGFTEIITTPGLELAEDERQNMVDRIRLNVDAITNIVDEMLRTAERSSTDYYPKTGKILCNQFLSKILYSYREKVNSNIELNYTTSVINRFTLQTNEEGLEQIMHHLIENAIKFTHEGSIEVNCSQNDSGKVVITVTDTGLGIAKEQQAKIFEQFFKVDNFQQGIGLGLTVSKKIANKLGGDLFLDSDYTGGARFVLTLPLE